jgi:hypothetical protein
LRRLLTLLFLATLSVIGTTAAHASSPPVTFTDIVRDTDTFTDVVPCQENLGPYDIMIRERGVFHVTAAGLDGEDLIPPYHLTGTFTGTFVAMPSDGTGPTFTGRFTNWFGENVNPMNSTGTTTFSLRGTSSSGERITFHDVFHYTITGTGVEMSFDKPSC